MDYIHLYPCILKACHTDCTGTASLRFQVILRITGISMIESRSGPQTCPKSPIKQRESKFTTTDAIVCAV